MIWDFRTYYMAALALCLVIAMGLAGMQTVRLTGANARIAELQADIAKREEAAATRLAAETAKVLAAERRASEIRAQQEKADADHVQTVQRLQADLRARSRAAGGPGLRDPHATPCPRGGGGADPAPTATVDSGAADDTEAAGVLSEPLERLLLELAAEADEINVAYASCRAQALTGRAEPAPSP